MSKTEAKIKIGRFGLYHLKTLLISYIVWVLIATGLMLRIAYVHCLEASVSVLAWLFIQLAPLTSLFHRPSWLIFVVPSILCVIGGLLIKHGLGCFLIILGITIWFSLGIVITALGIT